MPVTMVAEGDGGSETRVEVRSPLQDNDLRLLPEGRGVVQFGSPLATEEHELLGSWFDAHPDAELRAWGLLPSTLDFLRHYPRLNRFTVDCASRDVADASGLRHLPESLRSLAIDIRLPGDDDLATMGRLRRLDSLRLGSIRRLPASAAGLPVTELVLCDVRSLDGIETLPEVRALQLHNVSARLEPVTALSHLADLTLAHGGCTDLTPLAQLPALRRFSAWLVRGLHDIAPAIGPRLEVLHLERLRQVVALPGLDGALSLARVRLAYLRGLVDLSPLRDAPALHELQLGEMEHLQPEDVAVLAGHPTLRRIFVGLGSDRKNRAVRDALRIDGDYGGHPWPVPEER